MMALHADPSTIQLPLYDSSLYNQKTFYIEAVGKGLVAEVL